MIVDKLDANHFSGSEIAEKIKGLCPNQLSVYYESANYLLNPYLFDSSANAIMVISNRQGNEVHISNCNCGYNGRGPNNTKKVLIGLGLDAEYADEIKYYNGIVAKFDDSGILSKKEIIVGAPFDSRAAYIGVGNIHYTNMLANLTRKQLYILNCNGKNLINIFKCLDLVAVESFEYYVGECNDEVRDFNIPYDVDVLRKYKTEDLKGSYIWINAKPFSIICFIGRKTPFAIINTIFMAITGDPLFCEIEAESPIIDVSGNLISSITARSKLAISIFSSFSHGKTYHDRIQLEGGVKYE